METKYCTYVACPKKKKNGKTLILIAPAEKFKRELNKQAIPFWEAEIYPSTPTDSIFYRLVLFAKTDTYVPIETNWKPEHSLTVDKSHDTRNIYENFSQFPLRQDYGDIVKYCIGRNPNSLFFNLDVKIASKEPVKVTVKKGQSKNKEKHRISLDIHVYNNGVNQLQNNYTLLELNTEKNYEEAISFYSNYIPQYLNGFQELVAFANEINGHPNKWISRGSQPLGNKVFYSLPDPSIHNEEVLVDSVNDGLSDDEEQLPKPNNSSSWWNNKKEDEKQPPSKQPHKWDDDDYSPPTPPQ